MDQKPTKTNVREFRAPSGDFIERLALQKRDMMRLYNQQARTLFVGPDAWGEMHESLRSYSRVNCFNVDVRVYGPNGVRVLGVEVVLVPWMYGVLLVPEWRAAS
jgi:hypothetical protein